MNTVNTVWKYGLLNISPILKVGRYFLNLELIRIFSEPQHGFCKDNRDSLIPYRECRGQTEAVCKMEEIAVTMEDGTDKMLFIERSCNNKRDGKLLFNVKDKMKN